MLTFFPRPSGEPDAFFTPVQFLFTNPANMPGVLMFLHRGFSDGIVIAFIQAQMLWFLFRRLRSLHHNGFNRLIQQFRIDDIGARDHNRKRSTVVELTR